MVTEREFVESVFLGESEQRLPPVPGTEETSSLLTSVGTCGGVKTAVEKMEGDAKLCAEGGQVGAVCIVGDVVHDDMGGSDLKTWTVETGAFGKQSCQQHRILATGQGDKDAVAVGDQTVVGTRLVKLAADFVYRFHDKNKPKFTQGGLTLSFPRKS